MDPVILPVFERKASMFPQSRFAQARILVVDDAPFNLKLIQAKLKATGFTVVETAVDGLDALEQTKLFEPDLVLLDLMMPNMDGFDYCERVRGDKSVPRFPIIVQTALGDRETKLRALCCGADDFLNKPLDLEEVSLRVHVHLERYFMTQDLEQMRGYLKMELEEAQNRISELREEADLATQQHLLKRHYEVLEAIAIQPNSAKN